MGVGQAVAAAVDKAAAIAAMAALRRRYMSWVFWLLGGFAEAAQFVVEDFVHAPAEQPRDAEGEGQRGIVFADLERVDRLARDAKCIRKVALAPALLGAQDAKIVLHVRLPIDWR